MTRTFARSAVTSIFTTSLDFVVLAALVELAGAGYAVATFLGTVVGSTSNFLINRAWAFRARDGHAGHQAVRYAAAQAGSIALHTAGVWLLTRLGTRYLVAKVVVSVGAYLVWNYPVNRRFVFAAGNTDGREHDARCVSWR